MRVQGEKIIEFLLNVLSVEESEKVSALICIGLAKLMLSGMIADERVSTLLDRLQVLFSYLHIGSTRSNHGLCVTRQCIEPGAPTVPSLLLPGVLLLLVCEPAAHAEGNICSLIMCPTLSDLCL